MTSTQTLFPFGYGSVTHSSVVREQEAGEGGWGMRDELKEKECLSSRLYLEEILKSSEFFVKPELFPYYKLIL